MAEEPPQIQPIEKLSALYRGYLAANKVVGNQNESDLSVHVSELTGLDGLLTNAEAYLALAETLHSMRHNLKDFQESADDSLNHLGKSLDRRVYDCATLINTTPSNHQWLKDSLNLYVTEINSALEPVESEGPEARLQVEIDRMNNAITDCYQREDLIGLTFASQNLLDGIKHVTEMIYPVALGPPNRPYKRSAHHEAQLRTEHFPPIIQGYIDSLRELREFGEGKEYVGFTYITKLGTYVADFEDLSPKPQGKQGKGLVARILGH